MDEITQWITVGIILLIVVIYIIRKIRHRGKGGCAGCGLSDCCAPRKNDGHTGNCCGTDRRNKKTK